MVRGRLGGAYIPTAKVGEGCAKDIDVVIPRDSPSLWIDLSAYFVSAGLGLA